MEEIKDNVLGVKKAGRPKVKIDINEGDNVGTVKSTDENQSVTLSIKDLRELLGASKQKDDTSLVTAMIEALRDIRKPYKSPEQEQNDKAMREQTRLLQERLRRTLEIDRVNCPHLQGSNALSEEQGNRTAIWWHRLDSGTYWGICSNCQRQFWPSDLDYRKWRGLKSGNRPSAAGERQFVDTKAWEKYEHPEPFSAPLGA